MLRQATLSRPEQVLAVLIPAPVLVYIGNPAIALLLGMCISLATNKRVFAASASIGKYSLQTAIVLLGLKLNGNQVLAISADYSLLVTVYVLLTLGTGLVLGKVLRNERRSNQLISSGTAICGGTTIASLSPVIGAKHEQTAVALSLVFLLNAIALFAYPYIGEFLALSQKQFGIWCALSIHDTSSVVATALIYGDEAGAIATTLKLGRTLWLVPLLIIASMLNKSEDTRVTLPLFIVFFIAAVLLATVIELPMFVTDTAGFLSKSLLVTALYLIGTEITRETLSQFRGIAVMHGVLLWLIVAPATLGVVIYLV